MIAQSIILCDIAQMITQEKILEKIEKWLKKKGNSKAELSRHLGYRTATTITNWITRGRVPMYRSVEIVEALGNNQKVILQKNIQFANCKVLQVGKIVLTKTELTTRN